jgi:hypothetical protein
LSVNCFAGRKNVFRERSQNTFWANVTNESIDGPIGRRKRFCLLTFFENSSRLSCRSQSVKLEWKFARPERDFFLLLLVRSLSYEEVDGGDWTIDNRLEQLEKKVLRLKKNFSPVKVCVTRAGMDNWNRRRGVSGFGLIGGQ